MILILFVIPVLAVIASIVVYRLNGKKEFLKLDLVQFFYAFILAPILFVWAKSLLYLLLRTDLDIRLTASELFLFDTIFSTLFLYVFAFIVMHSLTKSINLKVGIDPLHDIFSHSEYFHLWLTHLVIYLGGASLITFLALANLVIPFQILLSDFWFHMINVGGFISGLFVFLGLWLSDPKQSGAHFMRLMKLSFGLFFLIHVVMYFLIEPKFDIQYGLYWGSSSMFAAIVLCSFFAYKSERAQTVFDRISDFFKHQKWDMRVELFKDRS